MNVTTPARALQFVEAHRIVLASAKGPVPRLIDFIAGETIAGNWWSHPNASAIYNVLVRVTESDQVLVCRMILAKITLVHRRVWPAVVRLADRFAPAQIARVEEHHTTSGRHRTREVAFPAWVPADIDLMASRLEEGEAIAALSCWLPAGVFRL